MPTSDRYDVVVVGARCAGASTALLLARRGLRVLVLERARRGADTLSTHALMRGGAAQLRRWGVLERIAAAGTPPVRQVRFHYPGESATVSIRPAAGVDALYAPRRTLLDTALADAAVAAGAEIRYGVTVTDLVYDSEGRVSGVRGRDRSGAAVHAEAWLTVGADGVRSLVARRAGARTERIGAHRGAVVYGYWSGLDATGYEWFYRPGGAAGFIPTNDGEVCVFAGTSSERFAREVAGDVRAGYHRLLAEVAGGARGRLGAAQPPRRLRAFPGRPGFLRRAWGPGWALVGDAGYFLDPLSTHGMTDALRDAQLLAEAVGAVLCGTPEAAALSQFQARRDRLSGPTFAVVDQLAGYQWDTPAVRRLLFALSSAMTDEVEALSPIRSDT
ncbi:NAD(P)/FAD-dependent oxidoreductase [Phytohabitans rumicis]|uniref:FAD-dependent oxidoreductase n=1 Tax=Phytohabitans rumicis TaxID=1076125 RepID=A0A6V8LFZ4_9ACTN|nr:NAD(P)/FAD-dependent oxidoreductase [Phytohabitans rumicis]GFJ95234.1 FAD-dependent oxidoreductase [Phytohabitans rumicis]